MRILSLLICSIASTSLLCGCLSVNQQSNLERFTLTQDIAPQVFMSQQDVHVELTPALSLGGVTIELSDIAIRPAQNFRYVDDLDKELRLLTINRFMERGFPNNYHTSIFVSKFQGTLEGETKVWAYIEVRNNRNKLVFRDEFKEESKTTADGYGPLVSSLKESFIAIIDSTIDQVIGKNDK